MNGAELLLRSLGRMGVEQIFACPGSEWAPVWEVLAGAHGAADRIPAYISARHEEVSVAMASGYAKASGKLPAVMIHTGVGALHGAMALRAALHERIPMLVLTGESASFGEDGGGDPGPQWLRLLADVGGPARLVERCVKWSSALSSPALLAPALERACQLAAASPSGPVLLSIPLEHLLGPASGELPRAAPPPRPPAADPAALAELARDLVGAERPVIVTEEVGRDPRAVEHLVALAEHLGAPLLEGWQPAYLNFPRAHPLYGGIALPPAHGALRESDLIFLLASVVPWQPPSALPGPATRVVVLGEDPLHPQLPHGGIRADAILQGDVATALAALLEHVRRLLPAHKRDAAVEHFRALHRARAATRAEELHGAATARPIETRWLAHELDAVLPAGAIVVDETISQRLELHRFLERLEPGGYFAGHRGGLGTGLGTALGAKAAAPGRAVIAVIGDGSFHYNPVLAAFGAAQEHALPILVVLFDNAGYLSQKRDVTRHFPDGAAVRANRFAGTAIAPAPDYAALARAFGGHGERIEDPAGLRAALLRGLAASARGQLALIDVVLEPVNR